MSTTYTANAKLAQPATGDTGWGPVANGNMTTLDGVNAIGDLAVTLTEVPSASLNVKISAGQYIAQAGTAATYAGASSTAMTASSTNYIYLTGSGTKTVNTTGFPAGPTLYCPLAVVVAGSSTITSVADARVCFPVVGAGFLPLAGGTLTDGANVVLGTSTGTQIGTATTQKLGFFGHTPAVQPTVGAATASGSYTSTEQAMLQAVHDAVRALGLGS
jgi:hypothetical protein